LRFQQLLYEVSEADFRKNLAELAEMLDLEALLQRQIRTLSLGERLRCGLALSLLYRPRVLFLDEPTLGLDVTAVSMMRSFIARYNQQTGATILLTSHYMIDVEALCKRILLIDHGTLTYDGSLEALSVTLSPYKLLKVSTHEANDLLWDTYGDVVETEAKRASPRVRREQVPSVVARLLTDVSIADLTIEDPPLEHVIDQIYREGLSLQLQGGER
jgi:ABC-2 type transport system ATP-binding protein